MALIIEKEQYWDNVVEHYYDNVHFEAGAPRNIYDWLSQQYSITSDTGSKVLNCEDEKKGTFFVMKFGS